MVQKSSIILHVLISTAILALVTLSSSSDIHQELTDNDFYAKIADYKHTLVLFYMPWCKRSKLILPEFSKAAEELIANDPPIALVRVDCTEDSDKICAEFSEDSYPALKIFDDGHYKDVYNGPLRSYGMVRYMKAQAQPAWQELSSLQEVERFVNASQEPVVVGFLTPDSPMKAVFNKTSKNLKVMLRFAHFEVKAPSEAKVVLYRPPRLANKFEELFLTYEGEAVLIDLIKFILEHMHGLVPVRQLDNLEDFYDPLIIAYFVVDYELNPKRTHYWRNRILAIAAEFSEINFAVSSSDAFADELRTVGIDFISDEKPIVVARTSANKKFLMQEEFSIDALRRFVKNFQEGTLEEFVKSQPIPATQSDPVIVAVAKNFEKVVSKNRKDTLIKFYVPWCDHCKDFAPVYLELAEKLQEENIAIVEMDAQANDVPLPYEVKGYPTIYWAPKEKKDQPVKYAGGRSVDEFIKFIAKEATEELKGWDREGNVRVRRVKVEL